VGKEDAVARRLTVLGAAYLGTTQAACLAELGFDVLGLDIDATRIGALAGGKLGDGQTPRSPLGYWPGWACCWCRRCSCATT